MKYSVCIEAVYRNKGTFLESMRQVKEAGYQFIEFWTWWDKDIDAIRKAKKELGMEIVTFCTKFINPGDITLQEEYLVGLKESIEAAKLLDCSVLIAQAGWEYESLKKGITKNEHRKVFLETMMKAAEIIEKENMSLVIEPLNLLVDHPGYHLSTTEDAIEVIRQIDSPKIKLLFDIYHQQITEGNLIYNITENIDNIGHFHAAGNPGRTEITKGEINYRNVFEAISQTSYDGYIGLEYMTEENPISGLIEARNKVLV